MTVVTEDEESFRLFDQLKTRIIRLNRGYIHRKLSDEQLETLVFLFEFSRALRLWSHGRFDESLPSIVGCEPDTGFSQSLLHA